MQTSGTGEAGLRSLCRQEAWDPQMMQKLDMAQGQGRFSCKQPIDDLRAENLKSPADGGFNT